jgi:hypothetical protein
MRLLSFTNAPPFPGRSRWLSILAPDPYAFKRDDNYNEVWTLVGEYGGTVSRLTRSYNCGLRPHECNVALHMKRKLGSRGFEPRRPSSSLFPDNPYDVVESMAFLVAAVRQSLATVVYILRTNFLRCSRPYERAELSHVSPGVGVAEELQCIKIRH